MMADEDVRQQVEELKRRQGAVLLAHNYQIEEGQLAADFLGDSLDLSRRAVDLAEGNIVFAGVKFMAETAKILAPEKRVLLPRLDAGCPMADMITVGELRRLKAEHPGAAVVAYMNSTAEVKAESDACCTSANAARVVRAVPAAEVIFVPDRNLGSYVQMLVPEKKLHLFEAYCYVHDRIKPEDIVDARARHPRAEVLVHPEARPGVVALADEVLSTGGMLRYAVRAQAGEFIVATAQGLLQRLARENPGKRFFPAGAERICSNMKRTTLRDVLDALREGKYEIEIEPEVAGRAGRALREMLRIG